MFAEYRTTLEYLSADEAFGASSRETEGFSKCYKENVQNAPPKRAADATSRAFPVTRWPIIFRAASRDEADAAAALGELCVLYSQSIYKWFLHYVRNPEKAEDLTQEFIQHWLSREYLRFRPTSSRFRSFLVCALYNYMRDERDRQRAMRRGGGVPNESLDAWTREIVDPKASSGLQSCMDKEIALEVHQRTIQALRQDYESRGKMDRFQKIQPFIFGDDGGASYAQLAAAMGIATSHARQEVLRFRGKYFEYFQRNVRPLVANNGQELDDEVRYLLTLTVNVEIQDHQ